ncbi:MAG: IspD/TarI family cytidylyltransferase [Lachnospira sp.]|nr:IspD/TarI family cytidylyltransferase [Lachnospira sp.]
MNIAVVLSGGIGSRVGHDIPKQYIRVRHQMMITYCLRTLCDHPMIDAIQIVADELWQREIIHDLSVNGIEHNKILGFSKPGQNRQLSICNSLIDIRKHTIESNAVVMIHDAARPYLKTEQITDCLKALEGHDGVMPVLPMKDTIYYSEDGKKISKLLERSRIYAGQAPVVFRLERYLKANTKLSREELLCINGSSEPAMMSDLDIVMIPGDEKNIKITTKQDLEQFIEFHTKNHI